MILMIVFKSLCSLPNYQLFSFHISTCCRIRREDILLLVDIVFWVLRVLSCIKRKLEPSFSFPFWGLERGVGVGRWKVGDVIVVVSAF